MIVPDFYQLLSIRISVIVLVFVFLLYSNY